MINSTLKSTASPAVRLLEPSEIQPRHVKALQQVLRDEHNALTTLLQDLSHFQSSEQSDFFKGFTTVVDWSEVHAYVCASGLSRGDPLFKLLNIDESNEAARADVSTINGAHQAALSFLFEVFPGPHIILPPHVHELAEFLDILKRFVDLREVDDAELVDLYSQISRKSDAIDKLKKLYEKQVRLGKFPSKGASEEQLHDLFRKLSDDHSSNIQDWIKRVFAPMFLLGRWMSIDAYEDLLDLIRERDSRPPRLRFLIDHPDTTDFYKELCGATHDIAFWLSVLPDIPDKGKAQVEHDARALAFLQALNLRLFEQGRQLLFVSRGRDIRSVLARFPEWFSCMSDKYLHIPNNESQDHQVSWFDGSSRVPLINRSWLYFLELGAVWDRSANERIDLLQDRRNQIDNIICSLPKSKPSVGVRTVVADYIRDEIVRLDNVQALCSAQSAKFRNRPSRNKEISSELGKEPLIAFLRYITDPNAFLTQRQELQDELTLVLDRFNTILPPIPSQEPSDVFKPLLRSILEKVDHDSLVLGVTDRDLRGIMCELFNAVANGIRINQSTSLGRQLRGLRERTAPRPSQQSKKPIANDDIGSNVWLIHAMHAYLYNQFNKARQLLPQRKLRRLKGAMRAISHVLIADYWLLEEHRLWKAVEHLQEALRYTKGDVNGILRIAILNAFLGFELDASDEHGENHDAFRRSFGGQQFGIHDCLKQLELLYSETKVSLPKPLNVAIVNNMLYARSRISYIEVDEHDDLERVDQSEDYSQLPVFERETEILLERILKIGNLTILQRDTIAYYYLKKATLHPQLDYRQKALTLAREHFDEGEKTMLEKQNRGELCSREARLLSAHGFLLENLESALSKSVD